MPQKTPPINFIINLQVYPFDLMISIGQTDLELGKKLDRYTGLSEKEINNVRYTSDTCQGRFCQFSNGAYLIRLRHLPRTAEDYGNLSHEICHVVLTLMDRVGMKLKIMTSCEAYAYLTAFITENIFKRINKYY